MHTCALVAKDSSIDHFCHPNFDSPSIFARILDKDIGGYFSIEPTDEDAHSKQHYLPNTALIITKWLSECRHLSLRKTVFRDLDKRLSQLSHTTAGVVNIVDFMPRPRPSLSGRNRPLYPWIMRRVEGVRGRLQVQVSCFPAFNYARDAHETKVSPDGRRVTFTSKDLTMELFAVSHEDHDKERNAKPVKVKFRKSDKQHPHMLGCGVIAEVSIILVFRKRFKLARTVVDL